MIATKIITTITAIASKIITTTTIMIKIIRLAKAPGACWVLDVDNDVSIDLSKDKGRVKTNPHL